MSIYRILLFQIRSLAPRKAYMQKRTSKFRCLEKKKTIITWNIIGNNYSNYTSMKAFATRWKHKKDW